jgi:hypothetical protein
MVIDWFSTACCLLFICGTFKKRKPLLETGDRRQEGTGYRHQQPAASSQQPAGDLPSVLSSLGCSLDPPTFASAIKCHQKSTSNSAGSSIGSLAPPPPPGPPRGWAVCTCRASTSLAPLYSPCASSAFDWGSKVKARLPLRAPRQLPWSPPRGWCSCRLSHSAFCSLAH